MAPGGTQGVTLIRPLVVAAVLLMVLALPARAVVVETAPGASAHPAASASFPAPHLSFVPVALAATDDAPDHAQVSSLFERISAWFARIFGRERTAQVATPSVISDSDAPEPAEATTTTIVYQTVNQPVIERVVYREPVEPVENSIGGGVSETTLTARLQDLASQLNQRIQNAFLGAARSAVVENVSDITVDGVSGLTDADIPDGITASNYLPLAGGTLTGSLTGTDLTLSGDLTVSGAQTLSGALEVPYVSATSTTEASSFAYRVGIGTSTPNTGTLEIFDESNGSQIATIRSGGSGAWRQTVYRNSTFGPQFLGNHGRGTYEAPETLLSGNHFLPSLAAVGMDQPFERAPS